MNHSYLAMVSESATERTIWQKFILAGVVGWLLLMTSAVYADVALLVAEAVLVEKNPDVVPVTDETLDEEAAPAPSLIGAATDASYVSFGGWAVTGAGFIDAAVAVFDFNTTTSVSQATLTLPIEEVFPQNGAAPLEIYMYADNGVAEVTDYSAGFSAAIAEVNAAGLTQIDIDVTGPVNSALSTGRYVGFRVRSAVVPSSVAEDSVPAWTGAKFREDLYTLSFTPGAAPAVAKDAARFDGFTLEVQNIDVAGIGEVAAQMRMVDPNELIFQLTEAVVTSAGVTPPPLSGADLLNCSAFQPPAVADVAVGASSYSVNSGILDIPSVNFNNEQLSMRLELIEGSNPALFETLTIGAVQSGPSEATISALGGGLIVESSQDFVPLCHGWVLIGDSVRNRVVERNLLSGETGASYSFSQVPDQFTIDEANGAVYMTVHPEAERLYRLDLNTGVIASSHVSQNIGGFTYQWSLRDLALGVGGNIFALMYDNIQGDPGNDIPFSSSGLWLGLLNGSGGFLTESIPLSEPLRVEYDDALNHVFLASASNLATFDFNSITNTLTFVPGTDLAVGSSCTDFSVSPDGTRIAYSCPNGNRSDEDFSIVDMSPDAYFDSDGEWFLGSSPISATFNNAGTLLIATDNEKLYFFDVVTHLILEDFELGLLEGEQIKKIRISQDGNYLIIFLENEVHDESSKFYWMPMPAITGTPL
jgi:hypothetical protein